MAGFLYYVPFYPEHDCFIRYVQQKGQNNNRCKLAMSKNLYFVYRGKH